MNRILPASELTTEALPAPLGNVRDWTCCFRSAVCFILPHFFIFPVLSFTFFSVPSHVRRGNRGRRAVETPASRRSGARSRPLQGPHTHCQGLRVFTGSGCSRHAGPPVGAGAVRPGPATWSVQEPRQACVPAAALKLGRLGACAHSLTRAPADGCGRVQPSCVRAAPCPGQRGVSVCREARPVPVL